MDIWSRITNNIFQKAHTRRPEDTISYPVGFRGELEHESHLCTACGTCAYVCSPSAITLDTSPADAVTWQYQPLKCTYCGRCVEFCPTHALSFDKRLPRPMRKIPKVEDSIYYFACSRCGARIIPLPPEVLEEKYGSPVPEDIDRLNLMCERCRKQAHGASIKRGFTGE